MTVIPICLGDDLVAVVCPEGAQFSARVSQLGEDDPVVRFVALLCLYADDILTGRRPGPYSDPLAAARARRQAIPAAEYRSARAAGETIEAIAERLRVPVEQVILRAFDPDCIAPRRREVRWTRPSAPMLRRVSVRGGRVHISARDDR
jgi:hypothetical protein